MPRVALTFPGQGSQRPGMGRPWAGTPQWRLVSAAGEQLGRDVARLLLEADAAELARPREAQVATYLASLLALDGLRTTAGLEQLDVAVVAGHSLGEYTALVAAGVLSAEAGLRLVAERGEAMQAAADARPGTMAAVLGLEDDAVDSVCAQLREDGEEVWPANYNAPAHVVVSGSAQGVRAAGGRAAALGARRTLPIPVGGAYHTPLMAPARPRLEAALAGSAFANASVPVVANVDAGVHRVAADWPALLSRQLTAPVRWRHGVAAMHRDGVEAFIEVGPGGVLTGLAKRATAGAPAYAIGEPGDVAALAAALGRTS